MTELLSPSRRIGVGQVRRFSAAHALGWVERHGVREWRVTFPGKPPVPFETEADATDYAELVQREADRRLRR